MNRRTRTVVGLLLTFSLVCVALGTAFFLWRRNACASEVLRITETSGVRFVIEKSSCDLLAKDEFISVYATKLPTSPFQKMLGWVNRQSLLFRYDPGNEDNPLPSITASGQNQIRIALPKVSSIEVQNRTWNDRSISYEIGKIYYPTDSK
jgi:hypothetical protein